MGKQLKSWRDDFLRYYGRTSLLMRIFIGAAVSFAIVFLMTNKVIKKQNKELNSLKSRMQSMEPADVVELEITDMKNRQRNVGRTLASLKEDNRQLEETCGGLSRSDAGKNFLHLRLLIDRNDLRIVSERRMDMQNPNRKTGSNATGKAGRGTSMQVEFPAFLACESYDFEVIGSFRNIRQFLIDAYKSDALFFLNNIRMNQSSETVMDRNLKQHRALRCEFQAHIPYRSGTVTKAGKDRKQP